jgi:hypothetical protein
MALVSGLVIPASSDGTDETNHEVNDDTTRCVTSWGRLLSCSVLRSWDATCTAVVCSIWADKSMASGPLEGQKLCAGTRNGLLRALAGDGFGTTVMIDVTSLSIDTWRCFNDQD